MYCTYCGKPIEENTFLSDLEERLHNNHTCFNCDFWLEKAKEDKEQPDHRVAIVNGVHYYIADENEPGTMRGFDGAKFRILFNDGTFVETTNLWCQGNIPDRFKELFPDNAIFINRVHHWEEINKKSYFIAK